MPSAGRIPLETSREAPDCFDITAGFGEGLTAEKMKQCIWVRPEVVVQIDYTDWTPAKHLRESFFKDIRENKRARDVVKEDSSGF